jgi:hypothetical protein
VDSRPEISNTARRVWECCQQPEGWPEEIDSDRAGGFSSALSRLVHRGRLLQRTDLLDDRVPGPNGKGYVINVASYGIPETNDQTNTDPELDGSVLRPDIVGNPLPAHRSVNNYFNLNAFTPTPVGAGPIGNAGVGILEAPGTVAVSAGLAKSMAIRENLRLRFEATFTNVLNHTNYATPATSISIPAPLAY